MSGTTSPGPAPDALELAALLCSRVCHDLISPVGAIVNALEVLDDSNKPEDREFALELIRKSSKTASARLQFCRLAFGAAGRSLLFEVMWRADQPEFRWSHAWREGDVIVWDNRAVVHRATHYDPVKYKRFMQRTTIGGDELTVPQ